MDTIPAGTLVWNGPDRERRSKKALAIVKSKLDRHQMSYDVEIIARVGTACDVYEDGWILEENYIFNKETDMDFFKALTLDAFAIAKLKKLGVL